MHFSTISNVILFRLTVLISAAFLSVLAESVSAQQLCLRPGRVDEIKKQLASGTKPPADPKLREELIAMGQEISREDQKIRFAFKVEKKALAKYDEFLGKRQVRACEIVNTVGWPTISAVEADAVKNFMYVVSKALPLPMQLELYPIVIEADRAREIERNEIFAAYIDRLRLYSGSKQFFGTQAYVRDGFLVVAPIQNPESVDERRKAFRMEPLRTYERRLEMMNQMPLIRLVTDPRDEQAGPSAGSNAGKKTTAESDVLAGEEDEVIKIDTTAVTLDVTIPASVGVNTAGFGKQDFRVFENEKPVEIETFARVDAPFDIVLLLDLSGSMAEKVGLIRKSTRRFIELKRPGDRVAVVAFSDTQRVVSDLETDQAKLLELVRKIDGGGGSHVWDSIVFAQEMLDKSSGTERRKAIVLMSDGVDNSLFYARRGGSGIGFADLVEKVQKSSTAIFPIYLDTQVSGFRSEKGMYSDAFRTMNYIADQSAGNLYTAKKLDDLEGIYERVLKDVGTVYTLGFSPSDDEVKPGKWRRLRVEVPAYPGLRIKHRLGYFPKPAEPKKSPAK